MLVKVTPTTTLKALNDGADGTGEFEAIVATYDTDSVGDKIVPGAFTKSLDEWSTKSAAGHPLPVVWSHQHSDPFAHIGVVTEASEKAGEGLWVKGSLDLENPTARQVWKLLKGGRVNNFSFAYDVLDATPDESKGVTLLNQLSLYEVGPTLIGANQETRLLTVKGYEETHHLLNGVHTFTVGEQGPELVWPALKTGRVLSTKNEADLRKAVDLINGVLAQVGEASSTTTDGKAHPAAPAKSTPDEARDEEPNQTGPASPLDVLIQLVEMEGLS